MMTAIEFVSGPAWQRVGWTLLHFVWQGAAVAALASLAVGLLRLGHGRGRHAVYLVALGGMALCPVLTFLALPVPAAAVEQVIAKAPSRPVVYVAAAWSPEAKKARASGLITTAPPPATPDPPAGLGWRGSIVGGLRMALPWIIGGWLVGVFVFSARLLLGIAGSWRWRHDRKPLPEALGERVAVLASRLGLARRARVFVSSRAVQAMTVGWLRPMVLVPASLLSGMPPEVLEGVIAHELAHILRRDLWVNLFQRVVETLLFYHPALWWLSGRLRYERELCCDGLAVGATGHQVAYAQALEWAGRAAAPARGVSLAAGFAGRRKALLTRVRHVLGLAPAPQYAHGGLAGLAGVAAVVLVLVAVGASQVQAGGAKRSSVRELPPRWAKFRAKKVSFAQAGLEPLSAPELIERAAEALSIMNHSIVKAESHTTWWRDNRRSPNAGMRQMTGKMEDHKEMEVRLDLDGGRCAARERFWGNNGVPIEERASYIPNPVYRSWLWDGKRHYFYGFREPNPPGSVKIREGAVFSEEGMWSFYGPELQLRGYYSDAARQIGAGGFDSLMQDARSVRVRTKLEQINGSACYVLDADTVYGKYVLWIDPAHGYNVARFERTKRKGDLYGQRRLPWRFNKKTSSIQIIRFQQTDDVWVPMECEYRSGWKDPDGPMKTLIRHKRIEVKLNPDFDALASFVPDDIEEGARAEWRTAPDGPFGDKVALGFWKDGRFVASAERRFPSHLARVGDIVPDFTVKTLDGKRFRLSAHRGKVVLLHFLGSTGDDVAGLPGLKKWYDGLDDYREQFVMISLNISPEEDTIRRLAEEYSLTWPQAMGRKDGQSMASTDRGVWGLPAFVFIGPDGKIIPSDETSVMKILKELQRR